MEDNENNRKVGSIMSKQLMIDDNWRGLFTFGIYVDDNNRIYYGWICKECNKVFDTSFNLIKTFEEVRRHYFNYKVNITKNKLKKK